MTEEQNRERDEAERAINALLQWAYGESHDDEIESLTGCWPAPADLAEAIMCLGRDPRVAASAAVALRAAREVLGYPRRAETPTADEVADLNAKMAEADDEPQDGDEDPWYLTGQQQGIVALAGVERGANSTAVKAYRRAARAFTLGRFRDGWMSIVLNVPGSGGDILAEKMRVEYNKVAMWGSSSPGDGSPADELAGEGGAS